jgi:hypothetical protein
MVRRLWRTLSAQPAIRQGNSGELLPRAIASLTEPALFWLDGHYSHVVLIIITWIGPGVASA